MAGRVRIAQVIASAETGGAQRCALELAARLDPERYVSELVVAGPTAGGPLVEQARGRGVPVRHVRFRSLRSPLCDARLARALLPEHVVHVHSRPLDHQVGLLLGSAGRVLRGPRFVWTRHLPYGDLGPAALRRVRWAAKAASAVVACSPCVGRHLLETEGLPETRVHQIANGVDTGRFRPPSILERRILRRAHGAGEGPVMVAVGRLCAQKGFERLLETAARLRRPDLPDWQLWIVGDGPDRDALEGLASRLALGPRLRWLGDRADVDQLLRAADLFVLLSRREGLPLAVLEALASGLPAVVTDLPAYRGLRLGGALRRVPECEDDGRFADGAARSLRTLLLSPAARERLGARARRRIETGFGIGTWVERHADLYERILSGAAVATPAA